MQKSKKNEVKGDEEEKFDKRTRKKEPPPMESAYDEKDLVVIDNGSDTLKIGFSGTDWPQVGLQ